jgi:parallel beta-helix repeat protein
MRASRNVSLALGAAAASTLLSILATDTAAGARFDTAAAHGASRTGIGWFETANSDLLEAISVPVVSILAAAFLVAGWRHRRDRDVWLRAAVASTGSAATVFLIKQLHGGTFPSGHSCFAISLSFVIIVVAPPRFRVPLGLLAGAWSAAVGVSSIVAGGHLASDVGGGYLIAFAWAAGAAARFPAATTEGPRTDRLSRLLTAAGALAMALVAVEVAVLHSAGVPGSAAVAAAGIELIGVTSVLGLVALLPRVSTPLAPKTLAVVALLVFVGAGCASSPHGRVGSTLRYVSVHGSDSAPGTRSRPLRTLQAALKDARPGMTIIVASGTYRNPSVLTASGAVGAPVVIQAGPSASPVFTRRLKIAADHVRVNGLVFRWQGPPKNGDVLLYVSHGRDVLITHCRILHAPKSGIYVGDESANVRIVANLIERNGTDPRLDHGIYVGQVTGGLIANNVISHNAAYGIQLYPAARKVIVTENTIVDNGRSGVIIGGETTTSDYNVVVNNIVAFNHADGVRTYWAGPVGVGNKVLDNLVFGNSARGVVGPGITASGTISLRPGFVAPDRGDYRLRASSPAIERALLQYTTRFDYSGHPRPTTTLPSLGAYELGPSWAYSSRAETSSHP